MLLTHVLQTNYSTTDLIHFLRINVCVPNQYINSHTKYKERWEYYFFMMRPIFEEEKILSFFKTAFLIHVSCHNNDMVVLSTSYPPCWPSLFMSAAECVSKTYLTREVPIQFTRGNKTQPRLPGMETDNY